MKRFLTIAAALTVLIGTAGAASAQPGHNDRDNHNDRNDHHGPVVKAPPPMAMRGPSHAGWRKGGHIARNDWSRGQHVDYRSHHLSAPPRGYEWRQVDNNYVLAAATTGLIASIILASH